MTKKAGWRCGRRVNVCYLQLQFPCVWLSFCRRPIVTVLSVCLRINGDAESLHGYAINE
jgi:hypothetical protein